MGDYIGSPQIRAYNADCLVGMSRVGTAIRISIYGTTACPWDTVIPFAPLWEQYRRILKPKGALVLMATQPFATDLINSARKLFRYDLIWEKTGPVGHANAHHMPMRSHELILVFYQRLPKYNPQGVIPLEKPVRRKGSERKAGRRLHRSGRSQCTALYQLSPLGPPFLQPKRAPLSSYPEACGHDGVFCADIYRRGRHGPWTAVWAAAPPAWPVSAPGGGSLDLKKTRTSTPQPLAE